MVKESNMDNEKIKEFKKIRKNLVMHKQEEILCQ